MIYSIAWLLLIALGYACLASCCWMALMEFPHVRELVIGAGFGSERQ